MPIYIWIFSIVLFFFWIRYLAPLIITYKLLSENAKKPTRAYHKAACFDIYAIEDTTIPPGQWREIHTDIAFAAWFHFYVIIGKYSFTFTPLGNIAGNILTRSGHGVKGLRAHFGKMDNDYRNEWSVLMFNEAPPITSNYPKLIRKGDKVAQIEFYRVPSTYMFEVKKLSKSSRGNNGKGSSGR